MFHPYGKYLKPCPFCTGEARILHDPGVPLALFTVSCWECGAEKKVFSKWPEQAVASWNMRGGVPSSVEDAKSNEE